MRTLALLLLALPLAAQVQITKSAVTVVATTGSTVCTATSPTTTSVALKCVNGSDIWTSTGPLSVGTIGSTYQMNSTGGAITFIFNLPTAAGPVAYQVSATPTAGCPGGAVCTGQGTF